MCFSMLNPLKQSLPVQVVLKKNKRIRKLKEERNVCRGGGDEILYKTEGYDFTENTMLLEKKLSQMT